MSTYRRAPALGLLTAAALFILTACSGTTDATPADTSEAASATLKIGVVELFANPFFATAREGMQKAASEGNAELVINNGGADSAKEANFVNNYITQKVDAIVVSAASPTGSLATLRKAKAAEIPVVCYDTCVNPPDDMALVKSFVTSDNTKLGTTTGEQVANYVNTELGGHAKAVMLTCEQFDVCKQRRTGIDKELEGTGLDLVASQEGFQVDKATPIATSMLTAHPEAKVFIAQNEDAILAAAAAVKARNLTGKVAIFGIDVNPQVAVLLTQPRSGVKWTTGQAPFDMGYQAVKTAIAAARGQSVGEFYKYTAQPTFSSADPSTAVAYLKENPVDK